MRQTEARDALGRPVLGVFFAFGGALAYGCSQVLIRNNVDLVPPVVGSMIALFWGTLGFFVLSGRSLTERSWNFRRGALLFAASGVFSTLGILGMFVALERGQVVVVSPVLATNSLFTLLLVALLLRGVERLTIRVLAGGLLVAAGVVILSVG
jgi:drug/metabolite transporter (DMT)-like permease